ncbi:MAG TPA: DUF2306 domain-containing protein [Rhizomicrobium sp.]|nr:DUF2306 domain-containing protein [Rhizomicrobium sp.]
MNLEGVALLGWLHAAAASFALIAGAAALFMRKGTVLHRRIGRWYCCAILLAGATILAVYHRDVANFRDMGRGVSTPHVFGIFHWEAILSMVAVVLGFYAGRHRRNFWKYVHPSAMLISYHFVIAALISQMFGRVNALRALTRYQVEHHQTLTVAFLEQASVWVFLALLVHYRIQVIRQLRRQDKIVSAGFAPGE